MPERKVFMPYCDNDNCVEPPKFPERIDDYVVLDGLVLCVTCHETATTNQEGE